MTEYRRPHIPGATWFFTVNLAERRGNRLLVEHIESLRMAFVSVRQRHPFQVEAVVVLPDHLHCVWTLPPDDTDFSTRWNLLKGHFSRSIERNERISRSREKRRERGVWQRRFWEHCMCDQADLNRHIDYIHWNPVKHGWVDRARDWPYSSFHRFLSQGMYSEDWGVGDAIDIRGGE